MEKREPLYNYCENVNGATTIENHMEIPQKLKQKLKYDPVIRLLGIYPKKTKEVIQKYIYTYMHPYVLSNIIYNSQDMEATEVSIRR